MKGVLQTTLFRVRHRHWAGTRAPATTCRSVPTARRTGNELVPPSFKWSGMPDAFGIKVALPGLQQAVAESSRP
jgi:hypothetical protein